MLSGRRDPEPCILHGFYMVYYMVLYMVFYMVYYMVFYMVCPMAFYMVSKLVTGLPLSIQANHIGFTWVPASDKGQLPAMAWPGPGRRPEPCILHNLYIGFTWFL